MKLLMGLSSIIVLTGCAVLAFFLQRKISKYFTFRKKLQKKKNNSQDFDVPRTCELLKPNFVKVGHVEHLYMYPLLCGQKYSCPKISFTECGIITTVKDMMLRERMFHIYDEQNRQYLNIQDLESLSSIEMNVLNKSEVQFNAPEMSNLNINIKKTGKMLTEHRTNWVIIKFIDCGEIAADWVKKFFQRSTLRLVRREYKIIGEPKINEHVLREHMDSEAWEMLMAVTRYVVTTSGTMELVMKKSYPNCSKIQPNIVISSPSYPTFAEENWQWMKIGKIIMRKIVPAASLINMGKPQIDHDTEYLGIFYGLYNYGDINTNDEVFIHIEDPANI